MFLKVLHLGVWQQKQASGCQYPMSQKRNRVRGWLRCVNRELVTTLLPRILIGGDGEVVHTARFWANRYIGALEVKLVDVGYWFTNLQSNNINEATT